MTVCMIAADSIRLVLVDDHEVVRGGLRRVLEAQPGWSVEAVEWLLNNRGISSVGVDTLSLDHGPSTTFDVHNLLLGDADRIGLENVARLNTIPRSGAYVTIGAIPLEDGSGGPCRLLAGW